MFTGLITHIGVIKKVHKHASDMSVVIEVNPDFCEKIKLGDSIALCQSRIARM